MKEIEEVRDNGVRRGSILGIRPPLNVVHTGCATK